MEEFVTLQIGRSTWQGLKKDCVVTMTHNKDGGAAIDTAELERLRLQSAILAEMEKEGVQ